MLFVDPDARGRGVARALVSAVLDHARQARMFRIVTHASRPARPVFESLGFVADQENPNSRVRDVVVPNCDMRIDLSGATNSRSPAAGMSSRAMRQDPRKSPRARVGETVRRDLPQLRLRDCSETCLAPQWPPADAQPDRQAGAVPLPGVMTSRPRGFAVPRPSGAAQNQAGLWRPARVSRFNPCGSAGGRQGGSRFTSCARTGRR